MNLSKSKIIPRIYQVFTIATILLSFISYTPITDLNTPSLSTLFFGTIIAVIISKMLAVYSTIIWTMGDDYKTTPQKCFIYMYTLSMFLGIYVYVNIAISEKDREQLFILLKKHLLTSITFTLGILLFYGLSSFISYNLFKNENQTIFSHIFIISIIDFFMFFIFFIKFWYDYISKDSLL